MLRIPASRFAFFLALIGISSCGNQVLMDESISIPSEQWDRAYRYTSSFTLSDTIQTLNFLITLRNSQNYPYRNLYIFLKTESPGGNISIDTVNCPLASSEGKWLGKGFGGLYDNRILYRYKTRIKQSGTYTITMEQGMRDEVLDGIIEVGHRIEVAR